MIGPTAAAWKPSKGERAVSPGTRHAYLGSVDAQQNRPIPMRPFCKLALRLEQTQNWRPLRRKLSSKAFSRSVADPIIGVAESLDELQPPSASGRSWSEHVTADDTPRHDSATCSPPLDGRGSNSFSCARMRAEWSARWLCFASFCTLSAERERVNALPALPSLAVRLK